MIEWLLRDGTAFDWLVCVVPVLAFLLGLYGLRDRLAALWREAERDVAARHGGR